MDVRSSFSTSIPAVSAFGAVDIGKFIGSNRMTRTSSGAYRFAPILDADDEVVGEHAIYYVYSGQRFKVRNALTMNRLAQQAGVDSPNALIEIVGTAGLTDPIAPASFEDTYPGGPPSITPVGGASGGGVTPVGEGTPSVEPDAGDVMVIDPGTQPTPWLKYALIGLGVTAVGWGIYSYLQSRRGARDYSGLGGLRSTYIGAPPPLVDMDFGDLDEGDEEPEQKVEPAAPAAQISGFGRAHGRRHKCKCKGGKKRRSCCKK